MSIAAALALVFVVDAVVRQGLQGLAWAFPLGFVVWAYSVLLWSSSFSYDDEGARVQNGLKVWTIPWAAVAAVRVQYQLRLDLVDGRTVVVLGGPDAIRPKRPSLTRGERIIADPPIVALLTDVEDVHREYHAGAAPRDGVATEPEVRWETRLIVVGVALAALSAVSLFVLL